MTTESPVECVCVYVCDSLGCAFLRERGCGGTGGARQPSANDKLPTGSQNDTGRPAGYSKF